MEHILSLSGGKDSTAMLLHILELLDSGDDSYPLDEVVFADTGLEYPEMYEHLDKLRKVVVEHDIKWTVLMPEHPFEYYLYEHEYVGKDGTVHHGYGWAGARTRWCTRALKTAMTDRMMQDKKSIWYTGIACDEPHRLQKKINRRHVHPLVDWGWTEEMCLQYCYSHGYDWGGLYEHFSRVSCWCCPLQPINSLKSLYTYHPDLWQRLKDLDQKSPNGFRLDYTLEQLEIRFELDKEIENESMKKKDYYTELYRRFEAAGHPKKTYRRR